MSLLAHVKHGDRHFGRSVVRPLLLELQLRPAPRPVLGVEDEDVGGELKYAMILGWKFVIFAKLYTLL